MRKSDSSIESIPVLTVHRCDVEISNDGTEERWLELPTSQGHSVTCVLASIDE